MILTCARRALYALLFTLALLVFAAARGETAADASQALPITILHFNDFHGQLEPYTDAQTGESVGGLARLAGVVGKIREEDPKRPLLLLFGGDVLQGTITSTVFQGWPDMALFNELGVDAAVMGNHELDYGQEQFRRLLEGARFPVLTANVQAAPEPFATRPFALLHPPGGPRVALLGLTTADLVHTTHPRNAVGLSASDPIAVARRIVPGLESQADLVVVLSHLGVAGDRRLAHEVPGLDVIVGGHDHYAFDPPLEENGVWIVQAGERGRYLGRMDLRVDDHRAELVRYQLTPVDARSPVDREVETRVKGLAARAEAQVSEVIGRADVLLDGRRETVRRTESNLANLVADLAREQTGAQVALFNGGGFRSSIRAGEVRIKDIYEVFPFRNELVTGTLSGEQILQALGQSAAYPAVDNPGGFLQVSGLRYTIEGGRAVAVTIGGQPIDPKARYSLVVPDFLAAGGDGYASIAAMSDPVASGQLISDLLIQAFRSRGELSARLDGRIVRR